MVGPVATEVILSKPLKPEIRIEEATDTYGRFVMEPLDRGFSITIGNPMRRMLLSAITGSAITWVKIDGVLHEYSTIDHVKEEVMELLLNTKGIRVTSVTGRPGKMRLDVTGEGPIRAGDIMTSADFQIVNPQHHIATLDAPDARLVMEFNVEQGKGYQPASQADGLPVGTLPVDSIFSPVEKVNYTIQHTRVGQITDYERLVFEVWTDGTIKPTEAVQNAAENLVNHFFDLTTLTKVLKGVSQRMGRSLNIAPEAYQTAIETLELSPRTFNSMKRAHLSNIGQILEKTEEELLQIRNFGTRSLEELQTKVRQLGFLPADDTDNESATDDAPSKTVGGEG